MAGYTHAPKRPGSSRVTRARRVFAAVLIILVSASAVVAHAEKPAPPRDLSDMNLNDLMSLEITSASKHEQRLGDVASAITVLDGETIRRSGVTNIPEALRLVPGLIVQRIDGNKWAVAARGLTYRWSNSLLVLVDGRSVYSPVFSGVYWDVQDVVLEDVDRIEVIRGPGATVWGANAVTGVINIITRRASTTHGLLASATSSEREPLVAALRWGGTPREGVDARVFVRTTSRNSSKSSDEIGSLAAPVPLSMTGLRDGEDDSRLVHGGARLDWSPNKSDDLTFQVEASGGWSDGALPVPTFTAPYYRVHRTRTKIANSFGLARWSREMAGAGDLTVQAYVDHVDRADTLVRDLGTTADLDIQHHLRVGSRHEIVWGAGVRHVSINLTNGYLFKIEPASSARTLVSAFAQDEISLVPSRLRLTLGSKFERHAFTGLEVQPTIRTLWTPSGQQTIWAAWSRAVRAPALSDRNLLVRVSALEGPGLPVLLVCAGGGANIKSEVLQAWELGWRTTFSSKLSLDAAGFFNLHRGLFAFHGEGPFSMDPDPELHIVAIQRALNAHDADTRGVELTATWTPRTTVRLSASGTWYTARFREVAGAPEATIYQQEGSTPGFQATGHLSLDLPGNCEVDAIARHVGRVSAGFIPAYETLDLRAGWRLTSLLTVDLVGRDLFESGRFESNYPGALVIPTTVSRSIEARVTLLTR